MKKALLVAVLTFLSSSAFAGSVSECSVATMVPLLEKKLVLHVVESLKFSSIYVVPESVELKYEGLNKVFESRDPSDYREMESYSLHMTTERGTPLNAYNAKLVRFGSKSLIYFFAPGSEQIFDDEGNYVKTTCTLGALPITVENRNTLRTVHENSEYVYETADLIETR